MSDELESWAKKCLNCKHAYKRKDDADMIYCRLRKGCRYENADIKKSVVNSKLTEVEHE